MPTTGRNMINGLTINATMDQFGESVPYSDRYAGQSRANLAARGLCSPEGDEPTGYGHALDSDDSPRPLLSARRRDFGWLFYGKRARIVAARRVSGDHFVTVTACNVPKSPWVSPSIPAVKSRLLVGPAFEAVPESETPQPGDCDRLLAVVASCPTNRPLRL